MDTNRSLLFGAVAFQKGAVDADRLAETCAEWETEPTAALADLLVTRGLITAEQRSEVEKDVARELEAHGGDTRATLSATIGVSPIAANDKAAYRTGVLVAWLRHAFPTQGGHKVLHALSTAEQIRERYTLSHLHAKGGMGQVWLARDNALGRQIALKELRSDQAGNAAVCSRFLYEAKVTAQLEHPGIVPVYELGQGDPPFYTMRFMRGRTLSQAIRDYHDKEAAGQADSVERIELLTAFVGICHAVAYAHSRGIIHRDLKGQNVALGDYGEVVVLDWGLAKRIGPSQRGPESSRQIAVPTVASGLDATSADPDGDTTVSSLAESEPRGDSTVTDTPDDGSHSETTADLGSGAGGDLGAAAHANSPRAASFATTTGLVRTVEGQLLGTPGFMAPEQAQGRHDLLDERTDVYGLGAILYEILTGRPPFQGPRMSEIIRIICQVEPVHPSQIKAGIEPGLEAICLQALRKLPADRYASASELAQDVQRWLADEPVRAYPEPWTGRAMRWARRHKTAVSAAGGLLVAAAVALAISTTWIGVERSEAEAQSERARRAVLLLTKVADIGFEEQLDPLQREFLEQALEYYEQFTSRIATDPRVRLEHGSVYLRKGDIERTLGRMAESERSYRKAIEILEPLAKNTTGEAARALARCRTLLADLLVRIGQDKGRAQVLFDQAIALERAIANNPAASSVDRLRLGQSLKSRADLHRLNGQSATANPVYDQAIAVLEQALTADHLNPEIRNDLALAIDARGWIHRERGEIETAEQDYHRAIALLDALVAAFPTRPRYRESLARACNSLGLIEQSTGRSIAAGAQFRRELSLVERLAHDFPGRPEHKRELARTLMNLGNVLGDQGRVDDAEPELVRAIELNTAIAAASPQDVQIRLDLSKCHTNLGELRRAKGEIESAIRSFADSRAIAEKLAADFPDKQRYREQLAGNLGNLALALESVDSPKAEELYQKAIQSHEMLIAVYPDNIDYRIGLARNLANLGGVLAASERSDQAEAAYRRAVAALDGPPDNHQSPETTRQRGWILNNLGALLVSTKHPRAEGTLREALDAFETLVARKSASREDLQNLAIAHANMGDHLIDARRLPEAGPHLTSAVAGLERLVTEQPDFLATQSYIGMVYEIEGKWLDAGGKPRESKRALARAIDHQRRAVALSQNGRVYCQRLGSHLLALAWLDLKTGAGDEAAKIALELPKTVPSSGRPRACFDAARILARLVGSDSNASSRVELSRSRNVREHIGRLALFLREAIDADPKLAEAIKADVDIKRLNSHPEYREILRTLVDLAP